jgi:hypothetical protein
MSGPLFGARAPWRAGVVVVAAAATASGGALCLDALHEAQRAYQTESQLATTACTTRLVKAGRRLVDSYDRAIESAKLNGDPVRMASLQEERKQASAVVDRLERGGISDPLAEFMSLASGACIRPDLTREGLVAYYGFNEGAGKVVLDAVTKAPTPFGDAAWSVDDGNPVLDFRKPASALAPLSIAVGPAWTALVRAKFPIDTSQHEWSSLLVAGTARHHVIVSRTGEIGVFRDGFSGSGVQLKDLSGWHTLAIRAAQEKTTIWVDGVLKGTANASVVDPIQSFGNGPWSAERNYQTFAALMDGFVVYDRPLTDKEIAALGNRGF